MNKINNYADLMAEQKIIEAKIIEQKAVLNKGISALKEKVEPFLYLLPILNIFKKKDTGTSLLKFAASAGIDLLVGQNFCLNQIGWCDWYFRCF